MKKLIIYLFLCSTSYSVAQVNIYHPFPDSNNIWIGTDVGFDGINCFIYDNYNLYISGDTIIGIYAYHKLYKDGYVYSNCPPPGYYYFNQYYGAFRQDVTNRKIYLKFNGADTLAYDFNLNAGDTLPCTYLSGYSLNYVESIDSVIVGDDYRKMFWISTPYSPNYMALIEGIGSTHGAFAPFANNGECSNDLWCVYNENEVIWTWDQSGNGCTLISSSNEQISENDFFIFPNPATSFISINVTGGQPIEEAIIYNHFGQKALVAVPVNNTVDVTGLTPGIYFIEVITSESRAGTKLVVE
jgi:hypothetical protein